MSIQFNDLELRNGLVQQYLKRTGQDRELFETDEEFLKQFAADVNEADDEFVSEAIQASGEWEHDDSNQTDYPIIRRNIVSGTRDYPMLTDGSGNLILDIYKVAILKTSTSTIREEIYPTDIRKPDGQDLLDPVTTGVPTKYDKIANAIRFNVIPNYNATNGLEVYINRESQRFSFDDTTKKPGVPGVLHAWYYLVPAKKYIAINGTDSDFVKISNEVEAMRKRIIEQFSKRNKDNSNVYENEPIIYM